MPKLVVQEGYSQLREFIIPMGESSVGRDPASDVVIDSAAVSRRHVSIRRTDRQVILADVNSRNGTFINSMPLTGTVPLKHLDLIQIGDTVLVFHEIDTDTDAGADLEERQPDDASEPRYYDLDFLNRVFTAVEANVRQVVLGKDQVIRNVLIGFICDGHVLIEDVPGVGKTVLAQAIAKSVKAEFKRIQFTPDLLPTDVTGVNLYDEQTRDFRFVPGPVFANVVLADEINRGSPRTQSSLLECMSEAVVTVDGCGHVLPKPFFVVATQNTVDFHGTYPLPEAQLDRFLMRVHVGYPEHHVEKAILDSQVASHPINAISYIARAGEILQCQAVVRTVHVPDQVKDYIVTIAGETRKHPAFSYGCSPRAALALMRISQGLAAVNGRDYVMPRDVRDMAIIALSHRLPLRIQARGEWESAEHVLESILAALPLERWEKE